MNNLPKLPYGQGSFFYHTNGKIGYRKTFTSKDGQKIKKTVYGETPKECMEKMKEVEKDINRLFNASNKLLAEAMREWLDIFKKPTLKQQSYDRIVKTIDNQIAKYELGHMKYQCINSKDIQKHLALLDSEHLKYSTIKKTYDVLNPFFRYVCASEHFPNPMDLVTMPTEQNVTAKTKEIVWFEKKDIDLFIKECYATYPNGTPFYRFSLVFGANIYMGLRIGELIALQWKDIDFKNNTVYVSKTWVEKDNPDYDPTDSNSRKKIREIQQSNKTSKNRYVPLIPQAKKMLLDYKIQCEYSNPDDYVLSTHTRRFTDISQCNKTIANIQRNAGTKVQNASSHSLRHTCASLLFRAGNPIEIICQILGNSRDVCEKTYIHFVEEQIKEAANKVSQQLKVSF